MFKREGLDDCTGHQKGKRKREAKDYVEKDSGKGEKPGKVK